MFSVNRIPASYSLSPLACVALCAAVLALVAGLVAQASAAGQLLVVTALATYAAGASIMLACASRHLPSGPFGKANLVTLLRWTLTALLIGLWTEFEGRALLWLAVGVATAVLMLDGVDGWLARRYKEASRFGARFDMETDAAMILVLAALVWHADRAGAWVLLAGLMRYAFIAASLVQPWLGRALPPSRRRQAVCVAQVVALLCCLAPIVPQTWSPSIAAAGIATLSISFAIDVLWLWRSRRKTLSEPVW
jgi:phosphatidylglycerophosphate synthase